MATVYTTYTGGEVIASTSGGNYAGAPMQTVLTGTFDAARRGLAAADEADFITIPAGTHITHVFVEVLTVDDATHVFSVGDQTDPNGFAVDVDAATLGVTMGAGALVVSTTTGTYCAAANAVSVLATTGDPLDTLKIKVTVVCTIIA